MKLIIDIPKSEYMETKRYYDNLPEYSTVEAETYYIAHGTPLDDVMAEIQAKYDSIPWRNNEYDDGWIEALEWVLFSILDNIGKAESEDKK